ncbi:hypothetical protein DT076_16660 [Desertihabitans brevis]|uniref:Uncharacterized protein n=1 Tax=Desertihabitans brevis TaxID=2268447 RepID=A0A367YR27_9ACTN|nr:hypothetical protein [Desertihabitans brevis]RCK68278.1 hypothetical protein DT076_16660 [Desertihabitans brevis]
MSDGDKPAKRSRDLTPTGTTSDNDQTKTRPDDDQMSIGEYRQAMKDPALQDERYERTKAAIEKNPAIDALRQIGEEMASKVTAPAAEIAGKAARNPFERARGSMDPKPPSWSVPPLPEVKIRPQVGPEDVARQTKATVDALQELQGEIKNSNDEATEAAKSTKRLNKLVLLVAVLTLLATIAGVAVTIYTFHAGNN